MALAVFRFVVMALAIFRSTGWGEYPAGYSGRHKDKIATKPADH